MLRSSPLKRSTPLRNTKSSLTRKTKLRQVTQRAIARRRIVFGPQSRLCHTMPCCVCLEGGTEQRSKTEAHHEPPRSRGGIDVDCLPLCRDHHRRRHDRGVETFWGEAGIEWPLIIDYMRKLTIEQIANGEAA